MVVAVFLKPPVEVAAPLLVSQQGPNVYATTDLSTLDAPEKQGLNAMMEQLSCKTVMALGGLDAAGHFDPYLVLKFEFPWHAALREIFERIVALQLSEKETWIYILFYNELEIGTTIYSESVTVSSLETKLKLNLDFTPSFFVCGQNLNDKSSRLVISQSSEVGCLFSVFPDC
jgi:hypothetical protein